MVSCGCYVLAVARIPGARRCPPLVTVSRGLYTHHDRNPRKPPARTAVRARLITLTTWPPLSLSIFYRNTCVTRRSSHTEARVRSPISLGRNPCTPRRRPSSGISVTPHHMLSSHSRTLCGCTWPKPSPSAPLQPSASSCHHYTPTVHTGDRHLPARASHSCRHTPRANALQHILPYSPQRAPWMGGQTGTFTCLRLLTVAPPKLPSPLFCLVQKRLLQTL